ncbi:alanine--tRNA ligase, partial [Candidatus Bathyarchaeota archaeon]
MVEFPVEEYKVELFDELGYVRKKCPICGEYFWTMDPDQETCGEATAEGCSTYGFIGDPPTRRAYSYREMRETFLSFFERRGHERIRPYPTVARGRDDLLFVHASIIDFQPYVTEGIMPPPANPLVIVQPCMRFVDIDNVGLTFGRHLTIFEMGGHHAFNTPEQEIYWRDETVRYFHEFATGELGVRDEEIIYKEGVWVGGGNAGPDLETIIRGLEVATLVFMKFKVLDGQFRELPIRTVDTGYGIERFAWLSQGAVSAFHAVYGPLLDEVADIVGLELPEPELLAGPARLSSYMIIEKGFRRAEARARMARALGMDPEELDALLTPLEALFAILDHTKCLIIMLADGVVPSNVREGYLARLLIRRTYRLLRLLGAEGALSDIVEAQLRYWKPDYERLAESEDYIMEIVELEGKKYEQTISRGIELVKRLGRELRSSGLREIPEEKLVELYDSHGVPPEIVEEVAAEEGLEVRVPEDFYARVAERHVSVPLRAEEALPDMGPEVAELPPTKPLYYEDQYAREFEATVLKVIGDRYVILDQTAFYPEGGGQPADRGILKHDGGECRVLDVRRVGRVIAHVVEGVLPPEGARVKGLVDWGRRHDLMRAHTATHIILGAARRLLGKHVWQAGAQKGIEHSRLDITHYRHLTLDEIHAIERLANEVVRANLPVRTSWMPRGEAEARYGFRLYQGGAVPGREIRVVEIPGWDVEACGGTHCSRTGEVGLIKVLRAERVQDGVERLVFAVGDHALRAVQEQEEALARVAEVLNVPVGDVVKAVENTVSELRELRRKLNRALRRMAELEAEALLARAEELAGLKVIRADLGPVDPDYLIEVANELCDREPRAAVLLFSTGRTASFVVKLGQEALRAGLKASELAGELGRMVGGGGSGKDWFAQGGGP